MGKSLNGPDEADVLAMMAALSQLHSGHVELLVCLNGTGFVPAANITATMFLDVLPGSSLPPQVKAKSSWPCGTHKTMWACVYALLFTLDYAISKVYNQESLWAD